MNSQTKCISAAGGETLSNDVTVANCDSFLLWRIVSALTISDEAPADPFTNKEFHGGNDSVKIMASTFGNRGVDTRLFKFGMDFKPHARKRIPYQTFDVHSVLRFTA